MVFTTLGGYWLNPYFTTSLKDVPTRIKLLLPVDWNSNMSSIFITIGSLLIINILLLIAAYAKSGNDSIKFWKLDQRTPFNITRKYFLRLLLVKYDALLLQSLVLTLPTLLSPESASHRLLPLLLVSIHLILFSCLLLYTLRIWQSVRLG